MVKKNYLTAIKEALFEEMERNPDMVCQGEDIGILGGAFGATEGLQSQFGADRVVDMPISEGCIIRLRGWVGARRQRPSWLRCSSSTSSRAGSIRS